LADAGSGAEVAEAAAMNRERRPRPAGDGEHFADDDEVISARVHRVYLAVEAAERLGEVWRLWLVVPVALDVELLERAARKVEREIELVVREDVHRERGAAGEGRRGAAATREAPEEGRRAPR